MTRKERNFLLQSAKVEGKKRQPDLVIQVKEAGQWKDIAVMWESAVAHITGVRMTGIALSGKNKLHAIAVRPNCKKAKANGFEA